MSQSLILEGLHALKEAITNRGDAYEFKVYDTVKEVEAMLPGFKVVSDAPKGSDSTGEGDITLSVGGKVVNIEVKLSRNEQMGETSLRISPDKRTVEITKPDRVEPDAIPLYIEAGKAMFDEVRNYIKFVRTVEPLDINSKANMSFPFGSITKNAWIEARDAGYLKDLNQTVQFNDTKIIERLYNSKNVYYIQVGGAGLFYLGRNPMNLPVPRFDGKMQVEFRAKPGGSRPRSYGGQTIKVVGATYICAGRLKSNIRSNYSLDRVNDVIELFANK